MTAQVPERPANNALGLWALLRRLRPGADATIGFFLHTPWPASDVFSLLPAHAPAPALTAFVKLLCECIGMAAAASPADEQPRPHYCIHSQGRRVQVRL